MTPILATLFDRAYLHKGIALIRSLQQHHADGFRLFVLALDEVTETCAQGLHEERATVIPLSQIMTPQLEAARANRNNAEWCWTLTSAFTRYCLETLNLSSVAYVDADMFVFHSLNALYREVAHASVAITPHRFSPARARTHGVNGTYNVGWVYFRNDAIARACLNEWADLCANWCYQRSEQDGRGNWRFGDQAYFDQLVPKYGAHVVKDVGVNLAPWNVENYEYCFDGKLYVIAKDSERVTGITPLTLYHFHAHAYDARRGIFKRGGYALPQPIIEHVYLPYEKVVGEIAREMKHT